MATPAVPVPTVSAKVLIGWMEQDPAVRFLANDCVFPQPITTDEAIEMWRVHRQRVDALPVRTADAPVQLPMDAPEQAQADAFMRAMRHAPSILRVIKIDPIGLVAHQPVVVVDQVEKYRPFATSAANFANKSLSTLTHRGQVQIQAGPNSVDVLVPHSEYGFAFNPQQGFQIQEAGRHISVTAVQNRMLLWAGYHRSYARIASANPDGRDRSMLVALTTDADFFVSTNSPNQGLRAMVCGLRPFLLGDFFNGDLCITVNLKRKRWVLQIRAACVPVDDV
jgi:hypothetical protein